MTGCIFNIFPLIYMTTRQHSHFDIARVVTAVLSLVCYLMLYWGNTKHIRWMYWPYLTINSSLLLIWLLGSIFAIYFAGVIINKLLHPEVVEVQLNIWWIIYIAGLCLSSPFKLKRIAALMSNNPQDYNRPGEPQTSIVI